MNIVLMRFLIIVLIIIFTSKSYSIDQDQLINVKDLDYLFKSNLKKWNESVVFFDKKISMSKISNNNEVYYLKSLFKEGSVTIKPFFNNNVVDKINLEYEFYNFNEVLNHTILEHYMKLKNKYCSKITNDKKIIIEIIKCN